LDTVQKIWAPLKKLFAPPGIPSWLRACLRTQQSMKVSSPKQTARLLGKFM